MRATLEAKIAAELASLEETFTLWPDKARLRRIDNVRQMRAQLADTCRCGEESTDRATGYVDTCPLHPATVPVPDALAKLTASLARS